MFASKKGYLVIKIVYLVLCLLITVSSLINFNNHSQAVYELFDSMTEANIALTTGALIFASQLVYRLLIVTTIFLVYRVIHKRKRDIPSISVR